MKAVNYLSLAVLLGMVISSAAGAEALPKKYAIAVTYSDSRWELSSLETSMEKFIDLSSEYDNSEIVLLSFRGEELYTGTFYFSTTLNYDTFDYTESPGGAIELGKTDFYLEVPYFRNAKSITLSNKEKGLLLEIDVSHLAKCNENNFCSEYESMKYCPEDCYDYSIICSNNVLNILHEEGTDCGGVCPNPCTESLISVEDILFYVTGWLRGEIELGDVFGAIELFE